MLDLPDLSVQGVEHTNMHCSQFWIHVSRFSHFWLRPMRSCPKDGIPSDIWPTSLPYDDKLSVVAISL